MRDLGTERESTRGWILRTQSPNGSWKLILWLKPGRIYRKKLRKVEGWSKQSLEALLQEVQKVFVRREDEKKKQRTKLTVFTVDWVVLAWACVIGYRLFLTLHKTLKKHGGQKWSSLHKWNVLGSFIYTSVALCLTRIGSVQVHFSRLISAKWILS